MKIQNKIIISTRFGLISITCKTNSIHIILSLRLLVFIWIPASLSVSLPLFHIHLVHPLTVAGWASSRQFEFFFSHFFYEQETRMIFPSLLNYPSIYCFHSSHPLVCLVVTSTLLLTTFTLFLYYVAFSSFSFTIFLLILAHAPPLP